MLARSGLEQGDGAQVGDFGVLAELQTPEVGEEVEAHPVLQLLWFELNQALHKQHEQLFRVARLLVEDRLAQLGVLKGDVGAQKQELLLPVDQQVLCHHLQQIGPKVLQHHLHSPRAVPLRGQFETHQVFHTAPYTSQQLALWEGSLLVVGEPLENTHVFGS